MFFTYRRLSVTRAAEVSLCVIRGAGLSQGSKHTRTHTQAHTHTEAGQSNVEQAQRTEIRRGVMPPQRDRDITVVSACSLSPPARNRLA